MRKSLITNINFVTPLVVLAIIFISTIFENQKKLTIVSLLLIIFLLLILTKGNAMSENKIQKFESLLDENKNIFIVLNFVLFLVFQNYYLNYETITWDISSYMVASQELENNFLPFSTQWESKGPLNSVVYYLFSWLSNKNYVVFKIMNDVLVFLIAINFFAYIKKLKNNNFLNYSGFIFLLILFSAEWYVSEFTEFYCLFLISCAQLLFSKSNMPFLKYFLVGIIYSLSSLINQGSLVIFSGFIFYLILNKSIKRNIKQYLLLSIGFLIPYILTFILYYRAGILDILLINFLYIPLGYSASNAASLYELRVFLREFYDYNLFIYFTIVTIIIALLKEFIQNYKFIVSIMFKDLDSILFISGISYYFIAGHNYYHHLIYALYFFCILIVKLTRRSSKQLVSIMIVFSLFSNVYFYTDNSIDNLSNIDRIYDSYPLKKLSSEIGLYFENEEYNILALDYVLILYYLDKPSYSFIVHPTNHYQSYITNPLSDFGFIRKNEIQQLYNSRPDVIICNTLAIDNGGQVINVDPIQYSKEIDDNQINSCSLQYLGEEYISLDTEKYRKNENLSFYKDPYKDMNVFVKINK